jgi:hypothetical protein
MVEPWKIYYILYGQLEDGKYEMGVQNCDIWMCENTETWEDVSADRDLCRQTLKLHIKKRHRQLYRKRGKYTKTPPILAKLSSTYGGYYHYISIS